VRAMEAPAPDGGEEALAAHASGTRGCTALHASYSSCAIATWSRGCCGRSRRPSAAATGKRAQRAARNVPAWCARDGDYCLRGRGACSGARGACRTPQMKRGRGRSLPARLSPRLVGLMLERVLHWTQDRALHLTRGRDDRPACGSLPVLDSSWRRISARGGWPRCRALHRPRRRVAGLLEARQPARRPFLGGAPGPPGSPAITRRPVPPLVGGRGRGGGVSEAPSELRKQVFLMMGKARTFARLLRDWRGGPLSPGGGRQGVGGHAPVLGVPLKAGPRHTTASYGGQALRPLGQLRRRVGCRAPRSDRRRCCAAGAAAPAARFGQWLSLPPAPRPLRQPRRSDPWPPLI
jgi:hypothetical protein